MSVKGARAVYVFRYIDLLNMLVGAVLLSVWNLSELMI